MSRRIPLVALAALALSGTLAGCRKPPPKQTEAQQARAVSVAQVEPRAIVGALAASGDLVPREEAAVQPEVTGYRVAAVLADVGQYVKKGQVLVQLDPTLIEAQIAQAEANAEQAASQAARVKGLDKEGVLPEEQIQQRRFQARAAAAQLNDLKTRYSKMSVRAPVSGLILEKTVRPGDLSAGGATPWFRMARDGQIELAANMSEEDLARVRPGQSATVTLPSGAVVQGHVRLISPQIDPQTKLGQARVLLPVSNAVRSGGFGRAVFGDAAGTALAVPESAVRYDADGASLMTVGADNRVHRVLIEAGARGSGLVQIVKGPPAGTRVVANSASLLLEGDLIRPIDAAPHS
ncbi:efflux RND transporter periplasmic adaptor subunit [Phenylobacterium sp.]|uniref:efflux RND transporter periplasmic adaptor subunit n=1 Tax=Phenylobacterium sp. TaxID=1871053 RepID=UPI002DE8BACA|nr:efflux RND transporter periplasmic adaptor subunit [Phenylobacterium sp.]